MFDIAEVLKDIHPEVNYLKSDDFIRDGMLDSFDIITLVSEIEARFEVIIDGKNIVPENFKNIRSIEKLIENTADCKVYRR
jgi:acyl carrier protein